MNKIKKILIFSLTLVLLSTFTSPSYAFGGAIGRSVAKIFQKIVKDASKRGVTKYKNKWWDPGVPIRTASERYFRKGRIGKIESLGYGVGGAALYTYLAKNLSSEVSNELNSWSDPQSFLESIVKIEPYKKDSVGAGFFINDHMILTNYHVVEKYFEAKYSNINNEVTIPEDLLWARYIILDNEREIQYCYALEKNHKIGLTESNKCPNNYLLLYENIYQKTCLSENSDEIHSVAYFGGCKSGFWPIRQNDIEITLINGLKVLGVVKAADKDLDIAVIRITKAFKKNLLKQHLEFNSSNPKEGSAVLAVGHPYDLSYSVTKGIISAYRDNEKKYVDNNSKNIFFVQTDAAINYGNSGGPLLYKEKILGLNSTTLDKNLVEGISFSLHYNKLKDFLEKNLVPI